MSTPGPVRVGDVMNPELHSIDGLATVSDAMALMKRHGVEALAVNRRDETDEVGLVLVSDVAREVVARNRSPDRVNVYEIMSKAGVDPAPGHAHALRRAPVGAVPDLPLHRRRPRPQPHRLRNPPRPRNRPLTTAQNHRGPPPTRETRTPSANPLHSPAR